MSDIGLLMAGVLTTGQPVVPALPKEQAIQPDEAVQKSEKAKATSVSPNEIAPPELALPEIASELAPSQSQEQKNILNKIRQKINSKERGSRESGVGRSHCVAEDSSVRGFPTPHPTPAGKQATTEQTDPRGWLPLRLSVGVPPVVACGVRGKEEKQGYPEVINLSPTPPTPPTLSTPPTPYSLLPTPSTPDEMSQVTPVSQLTDVQPSDWVFGALRSLTERYKCITPSKDGTFKGNRVMTRYEFAGGLNACIEKIRELIATNTENLAKKEDLVTLERLQAEFKTEAEVQNRLDSLEERTAIAANQFSATTKLYGQAIFSVQGTNEADVFLYRGEEQPRKAKTNLTFASSSQLTFATSFTGRDLLLTGLSAGNLGASTQSLSTNMGRLGFESDTNNNNLVLNELSYRFAVFDNLGVVVGTAGVNAVNTFRGINPLEGSGDGAVSLFGQRNPILAIGSGTGGVGFDWQISSSISLQGVYSAQIPSFPGDIQVGGLFGGNYTVGTQLTFAPTDNVDVGIHYLFNHSPDGNLHTGIGDTQLASPFVPQTAFDTHAVGATATWRINPNLQLGGWGGWTTSKPFSLSGTVETTNWAVFAALPNLFRPGNLGGVLVGQPPKITSSTLPDGYNLPNFAVPDFETGGIQGGREDTSLHLELFYRAQINDNIALTPGLFVIFNSNHNAANDTLVIGAMRATFRF